MHDYLGLSAACLEGLILGAIFFGGLWWTVKRGLASRVPALWFSGSLVLRTALVLAGFYLVGAHHSGRLVLCLAGFVLARLALVGLSWGSRSGPPRPQSEVRHAP